MKKIILISVTVFLMTNIYSQEEGLEFCDCWGVSVSDEGTPVLFNISDGIRNGKPFEIVTLCNPITAPCSGTCEWRTIPGGALETGICQAAREEDGAAIMIQGDNGEWVPTDYKNISDMEKEGLVLKKLDLEIESRENITMSTNK